MKYFIGVKKISKKEQDICNKLLLSRFSANGAYQEYQALSRARKPRFKTLEEQELLEYFWNREWFCLRMELDRRIFPTKVLGEGDLIVIRKYLSALPRRVLQYPEKHETVVQFLDLLIRKSYSLVPII